MEVPKPQRVTRSRLLRPKEVELVKDKSVDEVMLKQLAGKKFQDIRDREKRAIKTKKAM